MSEKISKFSEPQFRAWVKNKKLIGPVSTDLTDHQVTNEEDKEHWRSFWLVDGHKNENAMTPGFLERVKDQVGILPTGVNLHDVHALVLFDEVATLPTIGRQLHLTGKLTDLFLLALYYLTNLRSWLML